MFVINDPKTGKSYKKEGDAQIYMGKKVRDKIDGNAIGLKGYELEITGGSDAQGFPMRGDLDTMGRKRPLVVSGVGAKLKEKGIKQRKTVHGHDRRAVGHDRQSVLRHDDWLRAVSRS